MLLVELVLTVEAAVGGLHRRILALVTIVLLRQVLAASCAVCLDLSLTLYLLVRCLYSGCAMLPNNDFLLRDHDRVDLVCSSVSTQIGFSFVLIE